MGAQLEMPIPQTRNIAFVAPFAFIVLSDVSTVVKLSSMF
jgi:hypothetical protein